MHTTLETPGLVFFKTRVDTEFNKTFILTHMTLHQELLPTVQILFAQQILNLQDQQI